jgi:hypothetical protein
MSSVESQSGATETVHKAREIVVGPYSDEFDAAGDILAFLEEAGVDLSDCLFSGHANPDLSEKEITDFEKEYDVIMPDEASDDALLFWFGTNLRGIDTNNPLWYALTAGTDFDEAPLIDVFSAETISKIVPESLVLMDEGIAWLTPEQLKAAMICRFIINR